MYSEYILTHGEEAERTAAGVDSAGQQGRAGQGRAGQAVQAVRGRPEVSCPEAPPLPGPENHRGHVSSLTYAMLLLWLSSLLRPASLRSRVRIPRSPLCCCAPNRFSHLSNQIRYPAAVLPSAAVSASQVRIPPPARGQSSLPAPSACQR